MPWRKLVVQDPRRHLETRLEGNPAARTIQLSNPTPPYEGWIVLGEPPPLAGSPDKIAMPTLRVNKEES